MHDRALHLISSLRLVAHPEGGHYRQVYRSPVTVKTTDERSERQALTTIYFLLMKGEVSRWHRVLSDEVWHFYEGDPLELVQGDPEFHDVTSHFLGPVGESVQPVQVIPAGAWQAARSMGNYTLAGCTVGPGFEFSDFQMLADLPKEAELLTNRHPDQTLYL